MRALEEVVKPDFEEEAVGRLVGGAITTLGVLPTVRLGGGRMSSTCIEKDSSGAKSPVKLAKVLPSRSVPRSESNVIWMSPQVPPSLESLIVGLIVAELNDLLSALPRRGAEEEADEMLAVFFKGLAVDAVDVDLDPDEDACVFLRVAISPDVLPAASFSAFALAACFRLEFSSISAVPLRIIWRYPAASFGSGGTSSFTGGVAEYARDGGIFFEMSFIGCSFLDELDIDVDESVLVDGPLKPARDAVRLGTDVLVLDAQVDVCADASKRGFGSRFPSFSFSALCRSARMTGSGWDCFHVT